MALCPLIVLATLSSAHGAPAQDQGGQDPFGINTAADVRLQKPVTERLKLTPIRTALKKLGADGGFALEAAAAIWPLKITILVDDQPVGTVMDRIADVLHGVWKADGTLYRLSIPSEWTSRETTYLEAEDAERRTEAIATINKLVAGAAVPYAQVNEILSSDQAKALPQSQRDALQAVASPDRYLLGSMFRNMSGADVSAFWAGRVMHTSAPLPATPGLGAIGSGDAVSASGGSASGPIPFGGGQQGYGVGGFAPPGRVSRGQSRGNAVQVIRVSAIYDPLTGHLALGTGGRDALARDRGTRLIDDPYPKGRLAKLPFGKEALDWTQADPELPDLAQPLKGTPPKGPYYGGASSMADALEWLHDKTGVPIVSDAFRTTVELPPSAANAMTWLQNLRERNSAYLRADHGFLMVRHGGFWRLRLMEAPEEQYAKLERANPPALDDYASFADGLNPMQTLPFRIRGAAALKVDPEPLRAGMNALQFYATLSGSDRQRVLAGAALAFAQLSSASQDLFLLAMEDPSEGTSIGRTLPNTATPQVESRLGFLLGAAAAAEAPGGQAIQMLFGVSPTEGVRFVIPVGLKF